MRPPRGGRFFHGKEDAVKLTRNGWITFFAGIAILAAGAVRIVTKFLGTGEPRGSMGEDFLMIVGMFAAWLLLTACWRVE